MIVLAINVKTNEVFNDIQDSPPGGCVAGERTMAAISVLGGSEEDYVEYVVPEEDTAACMSAKEIKWNQFGKHIQIVPFSGKERKQKEREQRKEAVEAEMLREQIELDAAEKLGLDTTERKANVDRLKAQHKEIKEKLRGR
jgi:hypothetical protein